MARRFTSRSEQLWSRWDRTFRWSLVVSLLLHVLILFMFRETVPLPDADLSAAGEDAGDERAAAGGGTEIIAIREAQPPPTPEAEPVPVEPVPVPDAPPQQEPPRERRQPLAGTGQTAAAGEGRGQDAGPGTETGTGRGNAGTGESGTGSTSAPSPRGLILPPSDRPSSVRGKTVTVYVFVDERGSVVSDSTRLNPSSGDRRFDNRLKQQAAEWKFRPGTRDGEPVATWFPYTITF